MSIAVIFAVLLLVGLLTLVSYVDRVYQEAGRFLSREFQDNIDVFEQKIEPALKVSRSRASLSMAVLTQLTIASIAMLIGFLVFHESDWNIYDVLQAVIGLLLVVIVCNRFLPFVFFSRTKGEWLVPWVLLLKGLIYLVMTTSGGLSSSRILASVSIPSIPGSQISSSTTSNLLLRSKSRQASPLSTDAAE